ncbi:MAG: RES domain-containing protein [Deltaproteobacteria bacterium]|nr:RES domain-containing protein [Deltaproteobacteria bacterium]
MLLYRVAPQLYANDLSGRGAQLFGGRWNPKGWTALYTAESAASAMLEYLPHYPETCAPPDLVLVTIEAPDTITIQKVDAASLPDNWSARPPAAGTVLLGREWLLTGKTVALRVPSIMLPYGKAWNLVLNPAHPEYGGIRIAEVVPLPVDPRLAEKLGGAGA